MNEEWLEIPGYEPYQASNLGRIKGNRGIRKPYKTPKGYLTVMLNLNGKKVNRFVHTLVMVAWKGECPNGYEVCHRDNDKTNNCADNLRYDTRSGNRKDSLIADQSPKARLNVKAVEQIRSSDQKPTEAAEYFGVAVSTIYRIRRGVTWVF